METFIYVTPIIKLKRNEIHLRQKNEERKLPPFEDEMTTHIEKLKDCTKEDILGKS